jgi:dienelactone hydrolase
LLTRGTLSFGVDFLQMAISSNIRLELLLLAGLAFQGCLQSSEHSDWVGGFKHKDEWIPIRAQFQTAGTGKQGTLQIVEAPQDQSTAARTPLTEILISNSAAHFRYTTSDKDVTFDGTINGDSLTGTARGKEGWSGPLQLFRVRFPAEDSLREYHGTYQFGLDEVLYLQNWSALSEVPLLFAFEESGILRGLYPVGRDRFFAGPGAAFPIAMESRVEFQRDGSGGIVSLTWQKHDTPPRVARKSFVERQEDIRFPSGEIELSGTLYLPGGEGRRLAVILVHGSGPQNRNDVLPFARFLVRRGIAVLGYDKRGVNESGGNWSTSSREDLAGDVVAAFEYLKTRDDIDARQIGLLGWTEAATVMPLAAARASDIAFLISVSGTGADDVLPITIERLRLPTLAIWGELDDRASAAKSKRFWDEAFTSAGSPQHTLIVLPGANHMMLAAEARSSSELPGQAFVPEYAQIILNWLATRFHGFDAVR